MKTTSLKTTLTAFLFLISFTINAQIWTAATSAKTQDKVKELRTTIPIKYQLFSLNTNELQSVLKSAPSRSLQKNYGNIIELPTMNGVLQKFNVQEASVLDNNLSKRFSDIKSYVAYGIDDPTSIARFSVSPIGLHAMITSGNHSTMYIDPYTKDKKEYICYAKTDLPASPNTFECLVEDNFKTNLSQNLTGNFKNANDGKLRTFRLALVCTGEYAQFHINNQGINQSASDQIKKAAVLAAMNTTMTRVNAIFEKDLALTMIIVDKTTDMIFLDAATDGLTNDSAGSLINESQTTCDNIVGFNNYDIGHAFSTGGGGLASLRSPCTNSKAKGITGSRRPIGDSYDVDYVAHEMGHQYGGNHTQNNNCNRSSASVEPGSGSTIMGYAGICSPNVQNSGDIYFHAISIQEMWNNISGGKSTCAEESNTGNTAPTADAGSDFVIPASTPFILKGNGTDSDSNNALTYCWEQMDNEPASMPPSATSTAGPAFRSLTPIASPDRFMPALPTVIAGATSSTWEVVPSVSRTMNFRLTVRDNAPGGGNTASDDTKISVAGGAGPFVVNIPNTAVNWAAGSTQTVTWDVAGTTANGINAANVDILLSTDGGNTYTTTIVSSITNDGSQEITVPNAVGTQNRIMVRGSGHIFYDISNANFEIIPGNGNDTQAPTAPTALTASNITLTTVDLNWNAATDNTAVTAYDVYRGNTIIETVTNTSFQVTGLSPDTDYSFSIKARDAAGNESDASNTVNITTLSGLDTQAPTAPTALAASNITLTTVDLNWNEATDNTAVTAYDVYRGNTIIETVTNTSFQVTGLSLGTDYSFSIKAKDAAGNESDASNTVNITTLSELDTQAPTAPTALTASNITLTTVDLNWNEATDNTAVTAYDVYRGNTIIETVTNTSFQITGLSPDTDYSFSIKAKDAAGNESDTSNTVNITTLPEENNCNGGISSFPYIEGFENTIGAWTQEIDENLDWTINSGGTPSRNTGPSNSLEGNYYIYIEASGNNVGFPNKNAILTSPCFDLTNLSAATFSFNYHMWGNTMGTIDLEASTDDGNSWVSIFNKSGSQGNNWNDASVDISTYLGAVLLLRFNATTGNGYRSDIAIDNIRIAETASADCAAVDLVINLDNYPEETSWSLTNGNATIASGGTYGSQPDGAIVTVTKCLEPGTYTFMLNDSYGDGICCGYGNGSYTLTSGETVLASGATFGNSESTTFTISDSVKESIIDNKTTTDQAKVSVFPNPLMYSNLLNVVASKENTMYSIFDMLGRNVMSGTLTNKTIDTNGLLSGSYILKLGISNSDKSIIIQFVKQ